MRTFAALVFCLVALITTTAGASLAGTIETTGVGTASIEPDRIFIELEVGVKGGSAYANETVTKSDLTRVLTLVPKGATLEVIGVSDEELAADRAQAEIILHAPPTDDLATALSTLVARAGGTVTFENRGDGRTAVTATIAAPTASSIDELRTGFAALPGIDPSDDRIWMSYALEDCFKAQRRELDRAVSAAHSIAIDRAKAMGVRILGVAGAASLGSDVTLNSRCGPNALARMGPIPYDDRAPATVREAARVAIRYVVTALSP